MAATAATAILIALLCSPGSTGVFIDFATRAVKVTWFIPGGGSPDMGNVSADGRLLWLSGRFDNVVFVAASTQVGADTVITADASDTITLTNVAAVNLHADDFSFI